MKELRCSKCGKLLAKIDDKQETKGIEIKCSRCKQVNKY